MELEVTDRDKEIICEYSTELLKVILVIPPRRLRVLADFVERSTGANYLGTEVEDDLRKMADMSEEVLRKINRDYEAERV